MQTSTFINTNLTKVKLSKYTHNILSRLRIKALIRGQNCDHNNNKTAFLARFILFTLGITTFVVITLIIYTHILNNQIYTKLKKILK